MLSLSHNKLNKIIGKPAPPPTPKIPILTESTSRWVFEVASMGSPSPPYLKLILSAKQVQENARNTKTMVYMLFLKSRKLFAKIKLDIGRLNTREHNDRIVSNVPAVVYDT